MNCWGGHSLRRISQRSLLRPTKLGRIFSKDWNSGWGFPGSNFVGISMNLALWDLYPYPWILFHEDNFIELALATSTRITLWKGLCGDLSLSIVVSVVALPENVCLVVRDPLLEFVFNSPSDSDADLPLVIQHFLRDFLESRLDCHRWVGQ